MTTEELKTLRDHRKDAFRKRASKLFNCTAQPDVTRGKATYGVLYAKPSKRVANNLAVSREILVLITTFDDQQHRTTDAIEYLIAQTGGRLETQTAIVIHEDMLGNVKLRNWGREKGLVILPIVGGDLVGSNFDLEKYLAVELFAHDPFDVTGPVSDDANFFGRRDLALDLARKLQGGTIRSCLGIRKVGKTSLLNRVIHDLEDNHDCHTVFLDCSKDAAWSKDAVSLMSWIAGAISYAVTVNKEYLAVDSRALPSKVADIEAATAQLQKAVESSTRPVVIVIDEVDYITPGSPTAATKWTSEFNLLWRNFRSVYQEITRTSNRLSLLIAGVSSKWFFVEKINEVENAALALIPEEYLSPLPRGASESMLKALATRAGLQFEQAVLSELAAAAGDHPYWSRKLCSYIHRNVPVDGRPRQIALEEARELVAKFVDSEGGAISRVALSHLFAVYSELRDPIKLCIEGRGRECSPAHASILSRYGVVRADGAIAGLMMEVGARLALAGNAAAAPARPPTDKPVEIAELDEWAEELAAVGRRRNILERKLRSFVANMLRFDRVTDKGKPSPKQRVLAAVPENRRKLLEHFSLDDLVEKLFWPELIAVPSREWPLFERVFGSKERFVQAAEIINDRPDAHAKKYDAADFALYRRGLDYIEECLRSIE